MSEIRCPRVDPICKGKLSRLRNPDRFVCTFCRRVFDVKTVRAIERARSVAASAIPEHGEAQNGLFDLPAARPATARGQG